MYKTIQSDVQPIVEANDTEELDQTVTEQDLASPDVDDDS